MTDVRPPGYVIGLLVVLLGATMAAPMLLDLLEGDPNWRGFALGGFLSMIGGGLIALACAPSRSGGLSLQQTFMLTVLSWVVLPLFGALPFMLGAPSASMTDAFFEAMSGLTTTGSTVFVGLDDMPSGTLLWRGMLNWFGGLGILIVALGFLPAMKVGGMQIFKSENFETFGKILPRAGEIAASMSWVYAALTVICAACYAAVGQSTFDSVVHAMTTISTGGFANYDSSFGDLGVLDEYIAAVFMIIASLPFVRLVQLASGHARPILQDEQVRGFLAVGGASVLALVLFLTFTGQTDDLELAFRKALFNTASILTGCGYSSEDYDNWGPFAVALFFLMGLIGGCAGSTCCSVKVFRYQIVIAAISAQIKRIHSPHGVFMPRYQGRPVDDALFGSVMAFMFMFFLSLGVITVAMGMLGHDTLTAVSGAATALGNIGPGLGPIIGPSGNFSSLSDATKWLLAVAMLLGRLELVSVFVLFTASFWRR